MALNGKKIVSFTHAPDIMTTENKLLTAVQIEYFTYLITLILFVSIFALLKILMHSNVLSDIHDEVFLSICQPMESKMINCLEYKFFIS